MRSIREIKPLIVFLGPTASGKTDAAIAVTQKVNGEIISCDSRLFYRGMDIGTAKPSPAQLATVPHHLIDIADPDQPISLAVYQEMCIEIIERLHSQDKIPVLVGGTGQYLRAITEAWNIPEQEPDNRIRGVLEKITEDEGKDGLFRYLEILDPEASLSIDKRNIRRVVRALEVIYMTGYRFSKLKSKGNNPYKLIQIGFKWSREELYRRVDLRIDNMFTDGLIQEVAGLLQKGYTTNLPGMSAIGYNEVALYLTGKLTLEETIMLIKRKTRQFVRRQANWFKPDDPEIHWFDPDEDVIDRVLKMIEDELNDCP
jgi:tRNA dimethylallyltransferase